MAFKYLKNISVEKILVATFFTSLFLNIQDVIIPNILTESLIYSEYLDISVYFFDVTWAVLILYFIINNKYFKLSNLGKKLFHVEQTQRVYFLAPLIFLLILTVSSFFSRNLGISLRQWLIFIEGLTAYFIILGNTMFHVKQSFIYKMFVPRETKDIFLNVGIFFALFNCILVFIQVFTGKSLGFYFIGESLLMIGQQDVATVTLFGQKILRGYGLFPHPNILAAFLSVVGYLFLTTSSFLHVPRETVKKQYSLFHVKHFIAVILAGGLILTFSKVALVAVLSILYKTLYVDQKIIPRETVKKQYSLFHVKHTLIFLMTLSTIVLLFSQKSFSEREISLLTYAHLIDVSVFGSGVGMYFYDLSNSYMSFNNPWLIQPVHNLFLITLYEAGVFALVTILLFMLSFFRTDIFKTLFHVEQKMLYFLGQNFVILLALLALSDHYFFTIPQGIFLFWITAGIASSLQYLSIDKLDK